MYMYYYYYYYYSVIDIDATFICYPFEAVFAVLDTAVIATVYTDNAFLI